jgi:aromatic amino acid aminotransferase I
MGIKCLGVPMDKDGILATGLDDLMEGWDEEARGGLRPKIVVLVP